MKNLQHLPGINLPSPAAHLLPHRLCHPCASDLTRIRRCRKTECGRIFCPFATLYSSLPQTGVLSLADAKSSRSYARSSPVTCDICKRECCRRCWLEEKYCRV